MARHSRWSEIRARRPIDAQAYQRAREDSDLGQLVYDLRTAAGFTQAQLAERMGTTQSAISRIEEGGGIEHQLETLRRLARALGRGLVISFPTEGGEEEPARIVLTEPARQAG
ncbi:MAG: helix-turn-helix domain-containing protein [Egibacteraceae bacterium]